MAAMIPPIHHTVWAGPDPIPYTFRANLESWQEHNPDWQHMLWTEAELADLEMVNRDLYDAARTEAPDDWLRWRADIARLEIVYQFGGVYADTDARCVAPCDPLRELSCWFAESPNAPGHATQAVFGAEADHPTIHRLLTSLPSSALLNTGKRINHRVGSRFVDTTLRGEADVLPWQWFASQSIKGRGKRPPIAPLYVDHGYYNSLRHAARPQIAAYHAAADVLDAAGVEWFLTSGLLLGHIREGRILPWDGDVDLGVWAADMPKVVGAFGDWPIKRNQPGQLWPVHDGIKIDIHAHFREADEVFKLHGRRQNIRMAHPAHLFDNMAPTIFYLRETRMPSPPEDYLAHMYGDWLTPKTDWQWNRDPLNIEHL